MNINIENRQKNIILLSIIGVIILFISIIAITINHFIYIAQFPIEVKILVAPKDAKLTVDNKNYETSGVARFKEGEHTLKIEKTGFTTIEKTITFKKGADNRIYESLENQNGDNSWFKSDRTNQTRFESISEYKAKKVQENYAEDRIFLITPYKNYVDGYNIYAEKNQKKTVIKIYLYACGETPQLNQFKNNAINYLTSNGINLSDYTVEYSNC
jgi:hypothetical protein